MCAITHQRRKMYAGLTDSAIWSSKVTTGGTSRGSRCTPNVVTADSNAHTAAARRNTGLGLMQSSTGNDGSRLRPRAPTASSKKKGDALGHPPLTASDRRGHIPSVV